MSASHDPFASRFDAIAVDHARTPSAAAIDHAMAMCAIEAEPDFATPGFYLLDDAQGRFSIDRDMGVVTLKDETLLSRERGAAHSVRLRVVEASGESYEQTLQLRITGRVPQMVGAEEFSFLAEMTADLNGDAPVIATPVITAPQPPAARTEPSVIIADWTKYAAAHARAGKDPIPRARRAFIAADLPVLTARTASAMLSVGEPLPPVGVQAPWSL